MTNMAFDDREYTDEALIKQLGLIELHSKDGSALEGGCACIETKHLYLLEGLSEEGVGFVSVEEKDFYSQLGDFARRVRKLMERGDFSQGLHGLMRDVMRKTHPKPIRHNNPKPRRYLPHGLTACEKRYPSVRRKLSRCIKVNEPREEAGEIESAVAVCRASIKCPP